MPTGSEHNKNCPRCRALPSAAPSDGIAIMTGEGSAQQPYRLVEGPEGLATMTDGEQPVHTALCLEPFGERTRPEK